MQFARNICIILLLCLSAIPASVIAQVNPEIYGGYIIAKSLDSGKVEFTVQLVTDCDVGLGDSIILHYYGEGCTDSGQMVLVSDSAYSNLLQYLICPIEVPPCQPGTTVPVGFTLWTYRGIFQKFITCTSYHYYIEQCCRPGAGAVPLKLSGWFRKIFWSSPEISRNLAHLECFPHTNLSLGLKFSGPDSLTMEHVHVDSIHNINTPSIAKPDSFHTGSYGVRLRGYNKWDKSLKQVSMAYLSFVIRQCDTWPLDVFSLHATGNTVEFVAGDTAVIQVGTNVLDSLQEVYFHWGNTLTHASSGQGYIMLHGTITNIVTNGQAISSLEFQTNSIPPGEYYTSLVIRDNGCRKTEGPKFMYFTVRILNRTGLHTADPPYLSISPNPASQQVQFHINPVIGTPELAVFDMQGRPVWREAITAPLTEIDVSTWPQGVYAVRYSGPGGSAVARLVVVR
jgi:hypothetical protein